MAHRLFIGLGSNLNKPIAQLKKALNYIKLQKDFSLLQCSSFYTSPPMDKMQQPDYINAVCEVETNLNAMACLDICQAIETKMGRVRDKQRWQARTLDLDLILFDQQIIKNARLIIPHYGMLQRSFVIIPLLEIAPNCKHPLIGELNKLDKNSFLEPLARILHGNAKNET